ncbi:MAG: sigma-70 family RNA polymerase sigma factor [Geminicoccaceae bacterium]
MIIAEELIAAIAIGQDRAAFARLFALYGPRIKAYLMRAGASEAAAEDLMQDVMLTIWQRAPSYDPAKASAATWIFTIARNRRIDALRRERRPEPIVEDETVAAPSTEALVASGQYAERLRAAIKTLPEEQSKALHEAYYRGKSHSEIARDTNVPLGTVKSRLRAALKQLRFVLESQT